MGRSTVLRRIQKITTGSYIISLPIDWIRENNLRVHDSVYVITDVNKNLIIRIPNTQLMVKLNVSEVFDEWFYDILKNFYIHGVDKVIIEGPINDAILSKVKDLRRNLVDVVIEELKNNKLVLKFADNPYAIDSNFIDKDLAKYRRIISEILRECCISDPEGFSRVKVEELIRESRKTMWYIHRMCSKAFREPERIRIPSILYSVYLEIIIRLREIAYYAHKMADYSPYARRDVDGLRTMCGMAIKMLNTLDLTEISRMRGEMLNMAMVILPQLTAYEAHLVFALEKLAYNMMRVAELYRTSKSMFEVYVHRELPLIEGDE